MRVSQVEAWRKLPLSLTELSIETTLRCGQSFRWRKVDNYWNCVLHGRLLSLRQDEECLQYKVAWPKDHPSIEKEDDTEDLLRHYFSLKHDLGSLYDQWSESDANFRKKAPRFTGIRILSQDAWEALVAFICSSNNNISRISQMVDKLCKHYGAHVGSVGDEPFHDFPSPKALSGQKVEAHLRELGFGYRAKYIADTARMISDQKPQGWLESLTNPLNPGWGQSPSVIETPTYRSAHDSLLSLSGVGPKVADCVCLMGLGWGEAVPVDTHVWQIAQRDYKFGKIKMKTLNKVLYDSVGDHFRKIWGPQAGWAQSVLFTANLKSFSEQAAAKPEPVEVTVKLEDETAGNVLKSRTRKRPAKISETVKVEQPEDTKEQKRRRTTRRIPEKPQSGND